jgi:hypothetical protein
MLQSQILLASVLFVSLLAVIHDIPNCTCPAPFISNPLYLVQ